MSGASPAMLLDFTNGECASPFVSLINLVARVSPVGLAIGVGVAGDVVTATDAAHDTPGIGDSTILSVEACWK